MAYIPVPEELFEADITAAQFRALAIISANILSKGKWTGYCCLGYTELAKSCYTTKSSMINTISQLQALGYLEITKRDSFNRSNALRLTLTSGLERSQNTSGNLKGYAPRGSFFNTPKGSLKDTPRGSLNDTVKGSFFDTEGSLNDTEGSFFDTPHKDLKFKNLNLKTKKNACAREQGSLNDTPSEAAGSDQIAPADGAAGRSMPIQESAKEVRAEAPAANIDAAALWRECQAEFTGIAADVVFGQAGNRYFLRKKSKFTLAGHIRALEVADWLAARGLSAEVLGDNVHYSQETIIGEVA